jgi:hypothetical protein
MTWNFTFLTCAAALLPKLLRDSRDAIAGRLHALLPTTVEHLRLGHAQTVRQNGIPRQMTWEELTELYRARQEPTDS